MLLLATVTAKTSATASATPTPASSSGTAWTRSRRRYKRTTVEKGNTERARAGGSGGASSAHLRPRGALAVGLPIMLRDMLVIAVTQEKAAVGERRYVRVVRDQQH